MFLNSGLKIFDIIDLLFRNPQSRKDLSRMLQNKNTDIDFLTVTKYIRTLRALSFDIKYINKKLYIFDTPFEITLEKDELKGFLVFLSVLDKIYKQTSNREVLYTKSKMIKFIKDKVKVNERLLSIDFKPSDITNKHLLKLMKFEKENTEKIKVKLKGNKSYVSILYKGLKFKRDGIFITGISLKNYKNKIFKLDKTEKIKPLYDNEKFTVQPFYDTVFKLTGRLIKNYTLKKGEKARYRTGEILITSRFEDKEELFSRLLKYGNYCEIVYPEDDIRKFSNKAKKLLKQYELMQ